MAGTLVVVTLRTTSLRAASRGATFAVLARFGRVGAVAGAAGAGWRVTRAAEGFEGFEGFGVRWVRVAAVRAGVVRRGASYSSSSGFGMTMSASPIPSRK